MARTFAIKDDALLRVGLARRRGAKPGSPRSLEVGGVTLDLSRGQVSFEGQSMEFTRNELRILRALMQSPGQVVTRAELMEELWQTDAYVDDNALAVNINRLRRSLEKIGVSGGFIETKRGQGYLVRSAQRAQGNV